MRGFILAAGFGTRLRPLTDHLPKALVPVAGRPLLRHSMDFLHAYNIYDIGVNTHYLPGQIEAFRSRSRASFEMFHESPEIRGTGGALHFARSFLGGDDTFIVINADIVARFDLDEQIRCFNESNDICRLFAFPSRGNGGTIVYNTETGGYIGAGSAIRRMYPAAGADFIGITLYRKAFLEFFVPHDFSILPVWKRALDAGANVSVGIISDGYWCDTGTPASVAKVHFDVIDGKLNLDIPADLRLDRENRRCVPAAWSRENADRTGEYCWIENPDIDCRGQVERTVIYPDALPFHETICRNVILTRWGELAFDG